MRTAHATREWRQTDQHQLHDPVPLAVILVRLALLFGALALLGARWAAVISAALVAVVLATGLVDADDRW